MPHPQEIFQGCDRLESLPRLFRDNYEWELSVLERELSPGARVLQVGCMDGLRLIRLLMRRPDLRLTGLDIDAELIELARAHADDAGIGIQFILGDITAPPPLERFDYAVCLNNTLGYIPEDGLAVEEMRQIAGSVLVSVYGERTTDGLAEEYFGTLGTVMTGVRHLGDCDLIAVEGLGEVRRYHAERLEAWTPEKQDTPLGYWARIAGTP